MILWMIVILLAVAADQVSKFIVIAQMELNESIVVIPHLLSFTHIKNTGAAWGMFSSARWIFLIISFVAMVALPIVLYKYRKVHTLFSLSLSLITGGAIGNMIDRIFAENGGVTDFIQFTFIDFPIFNIADICVCVGAALLFIYLIFLDKTFFSDDKKKKEAKETGTDDGKANRS